MVARRSIAICCRAPMHAGTRRSRRICRSTRGYPGFFLRQSRQLTFKVELLGPITLEFSRRIRSYLNQRVVFDPRFPVVCALPPYVHRPIERLSWSGRRRGLPLHLTATVFLNLL